MKDLNKYVLLVMKWLNDKDSVTQQELIDNRTAAYAAADAAAYAYADAYAYAAAYAAADAYAYADAYADAEEWVGEYFERSGDNKQDYIDALKGDVKTTMDAVNEFKGEWSNAEYANVDVRFIFECIDNKDTTCGIGSLVGDSKNNSPENYQQCCTREEFNQLVSECETNFGASVKYSEYILEFNKGDRVSCYVCHVGAYPMQQYCDSCGHELLSELIPEAKPVYTKEMADNGVMPSVGMSFKCSSGEVTELLLPIDESGMGVAMFDGEYCIICKSGMLPIDTRTDKEKAIDDIRASCGFNKLNSMEEQLLSSAHDKWVK